MIVTLEEAKSWLKIDYDDEDGDIKVIIDAAEIYLKNATDIVYDNTNPLAKLYCRVLIEEWHENKGLMVKNSTSDKVRYTLQSILAQLKYC